MLNITWLHEQQKTDIGMGDIVFPERPELNIATDFEWPCYFRTETWCVNGFQIEFNFVLAQRHASQLCQQNVTGVFVDALLADIRQKFFAGGR